MPVVGWIGALLGIVSLFAASITYIWIPSSTLSRMSLATLLASWIVLEVFLLWLIILTPQTRGFPFLLEVCCLIRLVVGFRPWVGTFCLTVTDSLSLILPSFKILGPFFLQLSQSILDANGSFYALSYCGRRTTATLYHQCNIGSEHVHHSS